MALTNIANRLTPSVPIELTFGAQAAATGRKFTTLIGHMAASPGSGSPYQVYPVVNVGSPAAALAEVNALAGANSQIGAMAFAFVNANAAAGGSNFPAFRVVLLPSYVNNFGPNQEALTAITFLRSDMIVSCYPASDSANEATLLAFVNLISGIDRDLSGQFGSFMTLGSIDNLTVAEAYDFNSRKVIVAYLPDSNTAAASVTASTTLGSPILTSLVAPTLSPTGDTVSSSSILINVSSTAGIYPGASITGTGIPTNTTVEAVTANTITMSQNATASATAESLTVINATPTTGIYPGAHISGTGIISNSTIISVTGNSITISSSATATGSSIAITIQNVVSQPSEIVASAHAAVMMASAFPYNPLTNVTIGGLIPPRKTSDWIPIDPNGASEAALTAGLSPLRVQPGNTVAFIRTRTTFTLESDGVTPATSYIDWQDLVVMNDFKEVCYGISQQPPFNGNPGGTKASKTIAALFKDEVLREAQSYEDQGAFQGVKTLAPQFIVAPSTTSRGRFDFFIPVNVIPGLFVIAGNIQAVEGVSDFTL